MLVCSCSRISKVGHPSQVRICPGCWWYTRNNGTLGNRIEVSSLRPNDTYKDRVWYSFIPSRTIILTVLINDIENRALVIMASLASKISLTIMNARLFVVNWCFAVSKIWKLHSRPWMMGTRTWAQTQNECRYIFSEWTWISSYILSVPQLEYLCNGT